MKLNFKNIVYFCQKRQISQMKNSLKKLDVCWMQIFTQFGMAINSNMFNIMLPIIREHAVYFVSKTASLQKQSQRVK